MLVIALPLNATSIAGPDAATFGWRGAQILARTRRSCRCSCPRQIAPIAKSDRGVPVQKYPINPG
jgi:hypothetical protein